MRDRERERKRETERERKKERGRERVRDRLLLQSEDTAHLRFLLKLIWRIKSDMYSSMVICIPAFL